ncbi:glycogen debranching enzyme, partial [Hortaea werneckii]
MAALLAIAALAAASPLHKQSLDTHALAKHYFGNDAPWYQDRIPYFECSDKKIQDVFYYRWKIFRAHQRDTGIRGYVSTEFLEDVSWQLEPWATLNDATGFHLGEGQWLRDRRFADDYINHMYNGGNDRHFTDWMEQSVWRRYTVDGDVESLTTHLTDMIDLYNEWDDAFDDSKGLYWREPLADATEYTISSIDASGGEDGFTGGEAFRPSINSYMWANARAIADTARVAGQDDVATDFDQRAAALKDRFQTSIWNTSLEHFIDRYYVDNEYVNYWEPIRGRELVGLVPWMFGMPDDNSTYSAAWKHLLDPEELRGSGGMRTVEPSYEYYMRQYRYAIVMGVPQLECQWNGPVWPYQTTQIL